MYFRKPCFSQVSLPLFCRLSHRSMPKVPKSNYLMPWKPAGKKKKKTKAPLLLKYGVFHSSALVILDNTMEIYVVPIRY